MNIYRIIEDGVDYIIRAETMREVISIGETAYIESFDDWQSDDFDVDDEKEYYHSEILQSCELIGKLAN